MQHTLLIVDRHQNAQLGIGIPTFFGFFTLRLLKNCQITQGQYVFRLLWTRFPCKRIFSISVSDADFSNRCTWAYHVLTGRGQQKIPLSACLPPPSCFTFL